MHPHILVVFISCLAVFSQYENGIAQKTAFSLSAIEFAEKINTSPDAAILDVRTPQEFAKGHIEKALNIVWNSSDFNKQIALLDKSRAVYIYCLSGARSAAAARQMRSDGFAQVFELNGGLLKWRAANLPEVLQNGNEESGMSQQQFAAKINSDKLVLVDFYADWCAPCKKMEPYLTAIAQDMKEKVVVIRINADDNPSLCRQMHIDALPVLQLYKNKEIIWSHTGYIEKADVLKHLQ